MREIVRPRSTPLKRVPRVGNRNNANKHHRCTFRPAVSLQIGAAREEPWTDTLTTECGNQIGAAYVKIKSRARSKGHHSLHIVASGKPSRASMVSMDPECESITSTVL